MANITTAATQTLVAATATSDTIISQCSHIEIVNHGSGVIYARFDGTAPTVAGAGCFPVLAGERFRYRAPGPNGTPQVGLISAGTPTVSIIGLNLD